MAGPRDVRLPFVVEERNVSGQHRKFEPEQQKQLEEIDASFLEDARASEPVAELDPLLEYAEREGQLLARVAEQEREIAQLKSRLERAETALAESMEKLAMTAIHESPTNPPPKNDVPDEAVPSTRP